MLPEKTMKEIFILYTPIRACIVIILIICLLGNNTCYNLVNRLDAKFI